MAKNQFNKEQISYSSTEANTPYTRAKNEWDERIGSARVQAKNWRLIAILSLIVSLVLLALLVFSLSMQKQVVFVAQVKKGGEVVNVAPLLQPYQPTQAQAEYFVGQFIQLTRSLPLDPVVAKNNWLKAYSYLTRSSSAELNKIMRKLKPLTKLGKQTVTVRIDDVNPLSPNTYQVDWTETTVSTANQREIQKAYSGVFTIMVKQPTTQKQILENPLGIHIVNFHLSVRDDK